MSQIAIAASEGVVLNAITLINKEQIDDAADCFAGEFTFNDRGIGVEITNEERLTEFFYKTQELHRDPLFQTKMIPVIGDRVIIEWTLKSHPDEVILRRLLPNASQLDTWGLNRVVIGRQDHCLDRLR